MKLLRKLNKVVFLQSQTLFTSLFEFLVMFFKFHFAMSVGGYEIQINLKFKLFFSRFFLSSVIYFFPFLISFAFCFDLVLNCFEILGH